MGNQFSGNFDFINKERNTPGFNYCILKYSPWIVHQKDTIDDSVDDFEEDYQPLELLYQTYKEYPPLLMDAFTHFYENNYFSIDKLRQEEEKQYTTMATIEDDKSVHNSEQGAGDIPNNVTPTFIDVFRIRCIFEIEELFGHGVLTNWLKKAKQVITYGFSIVRCI